MKKLSNLGIQIVTKSEEFKQIPKDAVSLLECFYHEENVPDNWRGIFTTLLSNELFNKTYPIIVLEISKYALEYLTNHNTKKEQLECHLLIANTHLKNGNAVASIDYFKTGLKLAIDENYDDIKTNFYVSMSQAYHQLGQVDKQINSLNEATKWSSSGDLENQCRLYNELGQAYSTKNEFQRAIEYFEKAQELSLSIKDKEYEGWSNNNLGTIYHKLGNDEKAISLYVKVIEKKDIINNASLISGAYWNLGNAYFSNLEYANSLNSLNQAYEIASRINNKYHLAGISISIGNLELTQNHFAKSIEIFQRALQIKKEIKDKMGICVCIGSMGLAYARQGEQSLAEEYYKQSLQLSREIGDKKLESSTLENLGHLYFHTNSDLSFNYFEKAIEAYEEIGQDVSQEEDKISFFGNIANVYDYAVLTSVNLKKIEKIFEYIERSKSKTFRDLLSSSVLHPSITNMEMNDLVTVESKFLDELEKINSLHSADEDPNTKYLKFEKLKQTRGKLSSIYQKMIFFDPEYVALRQGGSKTIIDLKILQDILLKKHAGIIEYFVTDKVLFILIITEEQLFLEQVQITKDELTQYVKEYQTKIKTKELNNSDILAKLSHYLIKPISEHFSKIKLLYFIPHDILHYVPLHALELKNKYIIQQVPVAYLPSATVLQYLNKKGNQKNNGINVFGFQFNDEAKKIAQIFGAKPHVNATIPDVMSNFNSDILHFSCHGFFDKYNALSSGIVLSGNTYTSKENYGFDVLTARHIFDQKINSNLVTLSACETGINENKPGDELIGLTRSFLYAGASSVMVSLWSVNAMATQDLMIEFYKNLKQGLEKTVSLQKAQIKIMSNSQYSNPYYWAPFIIVGD